jgi:hypothetical protein
MVSAVKKPLLDTLEDETSVQGASVVRSLPLPELADIVKASQRQMPRCVAYGRKVATAAEELPKRMKRIMADAESTFGRA